MRSAAVAAHQEPAETTALSHSNLCGFVASQCTHCCQAEGT